MVSIPKVVSVLSCGFLLCLGLSAAAQAENAASAQDEMKAAQPDHRLGGQEAGEKHLKDPMKGAQSKGDKTIRGEMLRIEGDNYFVKGQDGKEVRLHTDKTTQILRPIQEGDQIEARVNNQNHTLSIGSLGRGTYAGDGNEIRRPTDSPLESDKPNTLGQ
ncbi:MAG TPA: hypothetical protein VES92_11555 [Nitrospiraceae bacterium]|nr:hypothetical protein [Nitrospiraceae bacterium]